MAKKYKAKYSGRIYDTREEAIQDNTKYINNVDYRYTIKSRKLNGAKSYRVPFIDEKRITLSNAGLATGAVLSENMLDTIAKYANASGLPIKTALGLVTKESTLGNPTDDASVYKVLNPAAAWYFKELGTGQHINPGTPVYERELVNFYKDEINPYQEARKYASKNNSDGNVDGYLNRLKAGEAYADKKAKRYEETYSNKNVLQAAFRDYKKNPKGYNPGQSNYQQLVNKRANEVWNSPEIQSWRKRRNLENGGR